jgi:hypothetical protein
MLANVFEWYVWFHIISSWFFVHHPTARVFISFTISVRRYTSAKLPPSTDGFIPFLWFLQELSLSIWLGRANHYLSMKMKKAIVRDTCI